MSIPRKKVPMTTDQVRRELRRRLPPDTFEPRPSRGWLAIGLVAIEAGLVAWIAAAQPSWPLALIGSIVISQLLTSSSLIAHEALHGATFRAVWAQKLVSLLTFGQMLIPPELWRSWHVQVHHSHTNIPGRDPESPGWVDTVPHEPVELFYSHVFPGRGGWVSCVSPFFLFIGQAQMVLWHHGSKPAFGATRMGTARGRAWVRAQFAALLLAQVALAISIGGRATFFAIILPHLITNATLMAYIFTNHWIEEAHASENDPLSNTLSVDTWRLLDWMHGWFSYHQEHHLFPTMSPVHAPRVHEALRDIHPDLPSRLPHWQALRWIYKTPRAYERSGQALVTLDGKKRVAIEEIRRAVKRVGGG
jgi:fatty acid desaturase